MTIRINPIDKHVGSRLRMRRIMLNQTQTEIGDALGLTFPDQGDAVRCSEEVAHVGGHLCGGLTRFRKSRRPRCSPEEKRYGTSRRRHSAGVGSR
jgi:hypothetical protein